MNQSGQVEMLPEGYPTRDVKFSEHYSIFCLALQHRLPESDLGVVSRALKDSGWFPHPSLKNLEQTKRFSIFNPQADSAIFGDTPWHENQTIDQWLRQRLRTTEGSRGAIEPVVLRLEPNRHFIITDREGAKVMPFKLHWVDLWLFPEGAGVLSFKTTLVADGDSVGIDEMSAFHRQIRDTRGETIVLDEDSGERKSFWDDIIVKEALGQGQCLGLDADPSKVIEGFDPYQRNAKILIAAQVASMGEGHELAWGRPLMDPPIRLQRSHEQLVEKGQWDVTLQAARASITAGYATVRDMILFELATVSDQGGAAGWNGNKTFQYCLEYVREMVENHFVEVWEYWNALILRDACAMVSFDSTMPLVSSSGHPDGIGQAEDRYYPMYVYAYHLRYATDRLSEELIDDHLADIMKAKKLRENFLRFRNRYWFHEITTDFLGREVYEKMSAGMGVNAAYEVVQDEVDRIAGYVREKYQAYTAVLIGVWSVITGVAALPHGWIVLSILAILGSVFVFSLAKGCTFSRKMAGWAQDKLRTIYQRFLELDLMHGA